MRRVLHICAAVLLMAQPALADEMGEDGYVDSDGVRLHFVTAGKGPLVVLLHGFPDFSYTWRDQMLALSDRFQMVAVSNDETWDAVHQYFQKSFGGEPVYLRLTHDPQGAAAKASQPSVKRVREACRSRRPAFGGCLGSFGITGASGSGLEL